MRFLCVFGTPRTGSSHLNKLLNSCREFKTKSELFHKQSPGKNLNPRELAALKARSGGAVTDLDSFVAWRRRHPADALEALSEGNRGRIVSFKIFGGHLSRELLDAEIFPRTDIAFAVLRRRPIESFISNLKAKSVAKFRGGNTTGIKPELTVDGFVEWARRMRSWYGYTQDKLEARGVPYAKISYERHLDGLSDGESLAAILDLLVPAGISGIAVPQGVEGKARQDKEHRYQDRVTNWDAFAQAIAADPEHAELFNWAETVPWAPE